MSYKSNDAKKELRREKKHEKGYIKDTRKDDTQESTVKSKSWVSVSCEKRVLDKLPVPMGKDRIASDMRIDGTIGGGLPWFDEGNRIVEAGDFKKGKENYAFPKKKANGYTGYNNDSSSVR